MSSTHRMKWAFIWGDIDGIGGTERRMLSAISGLNERGVTVHNIVRSNNKQSRFAREVLKVDSAALFTTRFPQIALATQKRSYDAIFTFGIRQSAIVRLAAAFLRQPATHIMVRNGLDYTWKELHFQFDRLTQRLVNLYLTNSHSVGEHLIAHGINSHRIRTLSSGIPEIWTTSPTTPRENGTRFIIAGNSRPEKNHHNSVLGFAEAGVPASLEIYTDKADDVNRTISTLAPHIQRRIHVHTGIKLGPAHYDEATVLLHASLSESLPRSILEATSRGCYVIATRTGDVPRLVASGNSLIIDPPSVDNIAEAVRHSYNTVTQNDYKRTRVEHPTEYNYISDLVNIVKETRTAQP